MMAPITVEGALECRGLQRATPTRAPVAAADLTGAIDTAPKIEAPARFFVINADWITELEHRAASAQDFARSAFGMPLCY
jgi:hypothetical protein